ncbi:MAG: hypothetical protein CMO66_07570 [Verrucomicrobiales bacterium]|nr:hypothetical protein [Verrucomicrobiales bacterium]|tara:strand:+ start:544 stop:987 length:444 start_codon:yes stop_codon:yes gene_type:complete
MSNDGFVPFGGEMGEVKPAADFIGFGKTEPDTTPLSGPADTPPVVPAEANDPAGAVRTVLADLTGDIPEDALNTAVRTILATVQAAPSRLTLPDLRLQEIPPVEPAEGEEAPARSQPELSLDKDGDKVTRIKVDCVCGETIVMDCDY